MSATATAASGTPQPANPLRPTAVPASRYHLTRPRVLASEWVKFRTLRSTWWTLGSTVAVLVLLAWLAAAQVRAFRDDVPEVASLGQADVLAAGASLAQLVAAVLGVLTITNEYSSGMIRATFTAVPPRTPVIVSKALVVLGSVVLAGAIGLALSVPIVRAILDPIGITMDWGDATTWRVLGGTVLFLGLIALLGLGAGTILRHTAAGVATVVGILFVLPIVATFFTGNHTVRDIAKFLPGSAGTAMTATSDLGDAYLTPGQGLAVAVAWAVVPLVVGMVLVKRRDA